MGQGWAKKLKMNVRLGLLDGFIPAEAICGKTIKQRHWSCSVEKIEKEHKLHHVAFIIQTKHKNQGIQCLEAATELLDEFEPGWLSASSVTQKCSTTCLRPGGQIVVHIYVCVFGQGGSQTSVFSLNAH